MIHIDIKEEFQELVDKPLLEGAVRATLEDLNPGGKTNLTVLVISNGEMQTLNHQYRGIDAPTDVLSFSSGDIDPATGEIYLGDVLISYPKAKHQAQTQGHTVEEELQLLTIHGVLHLLGHDHVSAKEKALMWGVQAEILAKLGLDKT